jgi:Flp pilus assembly protein protease CpaA
LIGALAFWISKGFGGGDAKLICAASLLVGAQALPEFLVLTAFLGGALGALTFGDMWLEKYYGWSTGLAYPLGDLTIPVPRQTTVPYGIAISLACVATLLATSTAFW